jgi:hypothetical protein
MLRSLSQSTTHAYAFASCHRFANCQAAEEKEEKQILARSAISGQGSFKKSGKLSYRELIPKLRQTLQAQMAAIKSGGSMDPSEVGPVLSAAQSGTFIYEGWSSDSVLVRESTRSCGRSNVSFARLSSR